MSDDAWSNSQIESKLWICRELENIYSKNDRYLDIWIFGSWIGVLPFILFTRENLKINKIVAFDIDEESLKQSRVINENYIISGKYETLKQDVNKIVYKSIPDIIINSSCEHMELNWWNNIPAGIMMVLQSNNYKRHDHINNVENLDDMDEKYPTSSLYRGEKLFSYPELKFTRFMIIGNKLEL